MTAQEAAALGYEVVKASDYEVGLTKNGKGIRTWWAYEFDRELPSLDHPVIQKAIEINERHESESANESNNLSGNPDQRLHQI